MRTPTAFGRPRSLFLSDFPWPEESRSTLPVNDDLIQAGADFTRSLSPPFALFAPFTASPDVNHL